MPAQALYDDFVGTSIDARLWTYWGDVARARVASSRLDLSLGADEEVGLTSRIAFRGDFDFVVDFLSFRATGSAPSSYVLTVLDAAGDPARASFVDLEISGSSSGRAFAARAEKNGNRHGSALVASSLSSGQLRLRRGSGTVFAEYRATTSAGWKRLRSWTPFLTDMVYVELSAFTPSGASLQLSSDKLLAGGQRYAAPAVYGASCGGLRAQAWSVPYLGNPGFGGLVLGPQANVPALHLIGFTRLAAKLDAAGAPGCTLYTTPDLLVAARGLDADGFGYGILPIPADPKLVGLKLYQQFAVLTTTNALRLQFSEGIEALVRKL